MSTGSKKIISSESISNSKLHALVIFVEFHLSKRYGRVVLSHDTEVSSFAKHKKEENCVEKKKGKIGNVGKK